MLGVLAALVAAAFVVLPPYGALAAAAAAVFALVVTRSPLAGLLVVAFFLPLERLGAYESAVGTIRVSQVVALLTMLAWGFCFIFRRGVRMHPNPLVLPLTVFLAINVLGLTQAPNLSYALGILMLTTFTVLVSWLVPQLVTDEQSLRRVVRALIISAGLVGLFGLFQFLGDSIGLPATITGLRELYTKSVFGFPRIQSTALEPLYFANYLLLPLGVLYALFLSRGIILRQWLAFLLLALLSANLVLTVSRGGYMGFGALLLVVTIFALRQFFRMRIILPLVIGVLLVGLFVSQVVNLGDVSKVNAETFVTHIQNVFYGPSFLERVDTFGQAKQALWQSPWIGLGPGSFGPFVAAHPLVKPEGGWKIVNNETMELLVETGILGFLALMTAVVIVVLRSLRAFRQQQADRMVRAVHLGLFGAFIGVLVQYQTFSVLYIMHIWFLLGLLVASQNLLLRSNHHVPSAIEHLIHRREAS